MAKTIKLNPSFVIGEIVYSKLGGEEPMGIVTGMLFRIPEYIEYEITWSNKGKTWCQIEELIDEEEYESQRIIKGL